MGTLAATSLVKHYGKRTVVKNVSLEIARGEVVGLLGPNGAGKTTSFYMIVGLVPADEGVVMLNGNEIMHLPMHVRARRGLGYLAQEPSVFRRLSVEDNLLAILETRKELEKSQQRELCDDLLRQFGLSALRESLAMRLSGGERRRLEIARSLTMEPAFILLDEPFAGIDPISISDIQSIIKQLASEGIGILITDHNVRETLGICARAYIMNEGAVLTHGPPDEILAPKIRAWARAVAILLLGVDPAFFTDAFTPEYSGIGAIRLAQYNGRQPATVLKQLGDPAELGDVPERAVVPDTMFRVEFPGVQPIASVGGRTLLSVLILGLLCVALALVMFRRSQSQAPAATTTTGASIGPASVSTPTTHPPSIRRLRTRQPRR